MAGSAVIGALRVNLGIDSAQFQDGIKKAQMSLGDFNRRMGSLAKTAGVALVGIGAGLGALAAKFIAASNVQQKAVAQLEAALKSTGNAVGISSNGLQQMAANLQKVTTYGDEAIIQVQALLLTFTKIGRDAFPLALEATLNVATAMGTDLKSAAVQVGKALNDPIAGVTALSRSGIQFTEDQKKLIKALVETGQTAQAQQLILKELDTQFGGSAKAARDTLGGALTALQNAWGDLFEVSGESTEGLRLQVERLTWVLSSPETMAAFQSFCTWMVQSLAAGIEMAAKAVNAIQDVVNAVGGIGKESTQSLLDQKKNIEQYQSLYGITDLSADPKYQKIVNELQSRVVAGSFGGLADGDNGTFATIEDLKRSLKGFKLDWADAGGIAGGAKKLADPIGIVSDKFTEMAKSARDAAEAIGNSLSGAVQGLLSDMKSGKSFAEAMTNQLSRLADQALSMALDGVFQAIMGAAFGNIGSSVAHLGSSVASVGGVNIAGGFNLSKRADGGPVMGGAPYMVGERGPELFVPGSSGGIVPNHALRGGGDSLNVHVTSEVVNGNLVPTMVQVAGEVAGKVVATNAPIAVAAAQRNRRF